MQKIEALHTQTGKWVLVDVFAVEASEYDAQGFIDWIQDNLYCKTIGMPGGTCIVTSHFSAFRAAT